MRTVISSILLLLVGSLLFSPVAFAAGTSDTVLAEIMRAQGSTGNTPIDCARVSTLDAARYGEALFATALDTSSKEYQALVGTLSPEKLAALYAETGLKALGCGTESEATTAPPPASNQTMTVSSAKGDTLALRTAAQASVPFRGEGIGFIATWTTIVWMFSALGFAVFMVWITSSKFRFQFRKMAEGEFDMNDKAMSILKERFARGEVTKEQFDKMRRDILN